MLVKPLANFLTIIAIAASALAQSGCPMTRAAEVPARLTMGPPRACEAGLQLEFEGLSLGASSNNCPLFVIVTPTHHESVPSSQRTYTEQVSTVAEQMLHFHCTGRYFLFFRIETTCEAGQTVNIGSLPILATKRCPEVAVLP